MPGIPLRFAARSTRDARLGGLRILRRSWDTKRIGVREYQNVCVEVSAYIRIYVSVYIDIYIYSSITWHVYKTTYVQIYIYIYTYLIDWFDLFWLIDWLIDWLVDDDINLYGMIAITILHIYIYTQIICILWYKLCDSFKKGHNIWYDCIWYIYIYKWYNANLTYDSSDILPITFHD